MTSDVAAVVTVRVRYPDFTTVSRARTLPEPTATTRDVHAGAVRLLDDLRDPSRAVRLVGVRLSGLRDSAGHAEQLALDDPERGWRHTDEAADRVRQRFGSGALARATLLETHPAETPPVAVPEGPQPDPASWWSW